MRRKTFKDRTAWLEARRQTIGSSDSAMVLGVRPSPLILYNEKVHGIQRGPVSIPQRVGLALEPTIADLYTEQTGRGIAETQLFGISEQFDWMSATIDGINEQGNIVEFKHITTRRLQELGDEEMEQVPEPWLVQVHHQMIVAEKQSAEIAVLIGNEDFRIYPVERNPELADLIIAMETEFAEAIRSQTPPWAGPQDNCSTVLRAYGPPNGAIQLSPDFDQMLVEVEMLKAIEKEAAERRERLRVLTGEALGTAGLGITPMGFEVRKTLRTRKGYTVEPTSFVEMRIKTPKGFKDDSSIVSGFFNRLRSGSGGSDTIGQAANHPFAAGRLAAES